MDESNQPNDDNKEESNWQYSAGDEKSYAGEGDSSQSWTTNMVKVDPVKWEASEYIAHEKSPVWYAGLIGGSIVMVVILYIFTKELLPSLVLFVAFLTAGFYAGRKPATKQFEIDSKGVKIDNDFQSYKNFRSFSIVEEEALDSVWLMPLKRFAPIAVMYFSPEDEDKIVNVLSNFLPVEQRELDAIDRFSKRIKF